MAAPTTDTDVCFTETVPVAVRHDASSSTSPSLPIAKTLQVAASVQSRAVPGRRDLVLQLTDESDPFFLFTLRLSEEDFAALKRSQDLKVGFAAFSDSVHQLLRLCITEAAMPQPKYTAELHVAGGGDATLLFIEANSFRNLTHLSLRLAPGNDACVKEHLAKCLRAAREDAAKTRADLRHVTAEAQSVVTQLEAKTALQAEKIAMLETKSATSTAQMQQRYDSEIAHLTDAVHRAEAELQRREAAEASGREQAVAAAQGALTQQVQALKDDVTRLTRQLNVAEGSLREMTVRAQTSDALARTLQADCDTLQRDKAMLTQTARTHETASGDARVRIAMLEQQVISAKDAAAQQMELGKSNLAQRERAEELAAQYKASLSKAEEQMTTAQHEIKRLETAVRRCAAEIQQCRAKIKTKNEVLIRQEAATTAAEDATRTLRAKADELAAQLAVATKTAEDAHKAQQSAQAELDDQKRLLRNSENVIAFLNRQLNEASVGAAEASAAGLSSFRPMAGGVSSTVASAAAATAAHASGLPVATFRQRAPLTRLSSNTPPPSLASVKAPSASSDSVLSGLDPKYLRQATDEHSHTIRYKPRSLTSPVPMLSDYNTAFQ